ncbi:hypothetical protein A7P95_10720 [Eikenella longinqua]|uniref:DUF4145 domain-containing protein n=1 Tax=Eikenella longinqua TaxID=1795827 RepID=A0A1A9RTS0_9NEIS|nr:hypothetical protein [Eikenella longinqua]OAM26164.1 hypothetical protein A7P95_10720 [Eikenella longinqua]
MTASPFNFEMFIEHLPVTSIERMELVKSALSTLDVIGSVLRTHLAAEQIIEAWIYAACNRANFFANTSTIFAAKRKIAVNLGLPNAVSELFHNVARIRNRFAHNQSVTEIDAELVAKIKEQLFSLMPEWRHDPDIGITFFRKDGSTEFEARLNDPNQPPHVMLAMIVSFVALFLANKTKEKHLSIKPCSYPC